MRVWGIIATAIAGSVIVVLGTVAFLLTRGTTLDFVDLTQTNLLVRSHWGMLSELFVLAFAVLSFLIFVVAAYVDLARVRKKVAEYAPPEWSKRFRERIVNDFAGTSVAEVARTLDDALADMSAVSQETQRELPFHLRRAMRLDIWHIYIRRLVAIEIVTLVVCAVYSAFAAALLPWSGSITAIPWLGFAAAALAIIIGGWLWIDDAIEGLLSILGKIRRPAVTENLPAGHTTTSVVHYDLIASALWHDLEPALTLYNEHTKLDNEALIERIAGLLTANQEAINRIIARGGDRNALQVPNPEISNLTKSVADVMQRLVSQLTRISDDQRGLQEAIKKYDHQMEDLGRRWSELGAKLGALEAAVIGVGRLTALGTGGPSKSLLEAAKSDGRPKVSSSAVAKELEALLTELESLPSQDPKVR